jgi:hypothetical protein
MQNLYEALRYHPAIAERVRARQSVGVLVGYDAAHRDIALRAFNGLPSPFFPRFLSLEDSSSAEQIEAIAAADLFIFLYMSSTNVAGPAFLAPLKSVLKQYWPKSVLFKDYGEHISEAFCEPLDAISERNRRLIALAQAARQVVYTDETGQCLTGTLSSGQTWTSIDGRGNPDVVPGEIATHIDDLNGKVCFSGTFLSTIPFAIKYRVVEHFCILHIENSRVVAFDTDNTQFADDFSLFLDAHTDHRVIEEFGIGTNMGVPRLYGRNAGFEERHPGLHLGLGGGAAGSHHMDLIFSRGELAFDRHTVFDGAFHL